MKNISSLIVLFFSVFFLSRASMKQIDSFEESEETIDSVTYQTLQHGYDLYKKGVNAHDNGNFKEAQHYYDQYMSLNLEVEYLNDILIDLIARSIGIAVEEEDWVRVSKLGARLDIIPNETREKYQNTPWAYLMYVFSLNMQNKCEEIERIIETGLYYVDKTYRPSEREYYELRLQQVISLINKNDYESANNKLLEIKKINESTGFHVVDKDIILAEQHIQKYKKDSIFSSKKEFVEKFSKDVINLCYLTAITKYSDVKEAWHALSKQAQNFVFHTYFDVNSRDDEEIWQQLMMYTSILINSFGKELEIEDRSEQNYDYILTCKNFLDWHSTKGTQAPVIWEQIKASMEANEIAIEFIPYTNEILLLSPNLTKPHIVEIDSLTMDRISMYNNDDPMVINAFYQKGSPLTDLITDLYPYIKDYEKLYISGSNEFAQFNYGAIPFKGKKLDFFFNVIPMISTADLLVKKQDDFPHNYKKVYLYGGMDYDNIAINTKRSANDSGWVYLSNVPYELRKGFKNLPYTQTEIDSIASLCKKYNIDHQKISGIDAIEATFKNSKYLNSSILHISTHSFLLPSYKFESISDLSKDKEISKMGTVLSNTGLLFSGCNQSLKNGSTNSGKEDEVLTAAEIAQMDLRNVDLVVLSACSSGLGDINNVNGIVYGLTNAFRTAGCKQILVSLWNVPDYTTSIFMHAFYDNLFQGRSQRESLKLAQNFLISVGYDDPFYWASFILLD